MSTATENSDPLLSLSDTNPSEPIQRKSRNFFQSKLIYYFNGPVYLYPNPQILSKLLPTTALTISPTQLSSFAPAHFVESQNNQPVQVSANLLSADSSSNVGRFNSPSSDLFARKLTPISAQRPDLLRSNSDLRQTHKSDPVSEILESDVGVPKPQTETPDAVSEIEASSSQDDKRSDSDSDDPFHK